MCAGTGSSPPEVFPGRREIPQSSRVGIQEPCRACWEQQHCLHQASCLAQWYQDVPKCSSLTPSVLVWSPNRATAAPSSAAKPQPLLHCWHSIPGHRGHKLGAAGTVGSRAGLGDWAGKHPPNRQSGYGWVLGIQQREASRSPARRNPKF